MYHRKGFTLIELLIVVIIIGVLATLAIPRYTGFVEKARAAEALSMITAMKSGEAAYKAQVGAYSTNIADLNIDNANTSNTAASNAGQLWFYGVPNANTYAYTISATRSTKTGGSNASYINFLWSDTTGASWAGNHPGTPKG